MGNYCEYEKGEKVQEFVVDGDLECGETEVGGD